MAKKKVLTTLGGKVVEINGDLPPNVNEGKEGYAPAYAPKTEQEWTNLFIGLGLLPPEE